MDNDLFKDINKKNKKKEFWRVLNQVEQAKEKMQRESMVNHERVSMLDEGSNELVKSALDQWLETITQGDIESITELLAIKSKEDMVWKTILSKKTPSESSKELSNQLNLFILPNITKKRNRRQNVKYMRRKLDAKHRELLTAKRLAEQEQAQEIVLELELEPVVDQGVPPVFEEEDVEDDFFPDKIDELMANGEVFLSRATGYHRGVPNIEDYCFISTKINPDN